MEVRWNHNGSLLAVAGSQSTVEKEINLVKFYNPNGHMVRQLKVPGKKLSSVSWEGGRLSRDHVKSYLQCPGREVGSHVIM